MVNTKKYNKDTILFTTAFKNINRQQWTNGQDRSINSYLKYFFNLVNNINYNLIVYLEKDTINMLNSFPIKSNIIIRDINEVDTFYTKYYLSNKKIISSTEYQLKVPVNRKQDAAHWSAEYNLINHSKINFVKHSKELYPGYEYYSWIDFGCIRDTIGDVPKNINFNKLKPSILYLCLEYPATQYSEEELIQTGEVFLAGSQFIVHRDLIELFEELWNEKLQEWDNKCICDDDQALVYQIYKDNPHLFDLFHSTEWFSLFRKHLNK